MTRLPRRTGSRLITTRAKAGFVVLRVRGSHHFLHHSDGRQTVVPVHRGETIGPGLLSQILCDCEVSREQFVALLR